MNYTYQYNLQSDKLLEANGPSLIQSYFIKQINHIAITAPPEKKTNN